MDVMLLGMICFFIFMLGFKAIKQYQFYKNSIFPQLYSSYFEYFYRYNLTKDLSQSSWLQQQLGEHHIIFHTINKTPAIQYTYLTILSKKGLSMIFDSKQVGVYKTNKNNDLIYTYQKKNYHIKSLGIISDSLISRYKKLQIECHVECLYAFNKQSDFSKLNASYKALYYQDVLPYIMAKEDLLTNEVIDTFFNSIKEQIDGNN